MEVEVKNLDCISGTGLCPEAQADGVPCTALGRDCKICEKAYPRAKPANSAAEAPA